MSRTPLYALFAALLLASGGASAQAPASIVTARTAIAVEQTLDGVIEPAQQATVAAQTGGRVAELPYDVDDYVEAGSVIVRFTDDVQRAALAQAKAAAREAEARLVEAKAAFRRIDDLYRRNAVSRQDLDRARADLSAAQARSAQARAAIDSATQELDYTVVRAPFSGVVVRRHVEIGETVVPGQPLMTGYSAERLRAVAQVPQAVARALRDRAGASARVLLDDGREILADGLVFSPYADAMTHTFRVRADLPAGTTGILPGTFVKVAFPVGTAERLLVPVSALAVRGEVRAVYVLDDSARPRMRQVRTGRTRGDQVEILSGLGVGERVAVDARAATFSATTTSQP